MVRAGVVDHTSEWKESGYNEIQNRRQRYAIIDHDRLLKLFEKRTVEDLKVLHRQWVEMGLEASVKKRDRKRSDSIAVGSDEFVFETKRHLGGGRVDLEGQDFILHEIQNPYGLFFNRPRQAAGALNELHAYLELCEAASRILNSLRGNLEFGILNLECATGAYFESAQRQRKSSK